MQKMQRTIERLRVEIDKLRREGTDQFETWSILPQLDNNLSGHCSYALVGRHSSLRQSKGDSDIGPMSPNRYH